MRGMEMVIEWTCVYQGTLLWCCLFEQRWEFEKYWFLDRANLISGAVSDIVQPRSQSFLQIGGWSKINVWVYVSGFEFVYVIDQYMVR